MKKYKAVSKISSNRNISSERVLNENVIGRLKRFKILSEKYRNRRKRFGLRFNLIAGIHNRELKHDDRDQNTRKTSFFDHEKLTVYQVAIEFVILAD